MIARRSSGVRTTVAAVLASLLLFGGSLLGKLSEEVTKIAGRTEGAVQPKLNDLGEALKAA